MKTSVIEVRDMLSVLSVLGLEKRIGAVPGVESVTVNYAGGSATVRYDETRLDPADIKSDVRQSEYECAAPNADADKGHMTRGAPASADAALAPKSASDPGGGAPTNPSPAVAKQKDEATPDGAVASKATVTPASASPKSTPETIPPADGTHAVDAGNDNAKEKATPHKG